MVLVELTSSSIKVNGHDLSDVVQSYSVDVQHGSVRVTLNAVPSLKDSAEAYFEGEADVQIVIPMTTFDFLDAVDAEWLQKQALADGDMDESIFETVLRILKGLARATGP